MIVFALTFLVIMLFQPLLKKYGPQPPAKPPTSQAARITAQLAAADSRPNFRRNNPTVAVNGCQADPQSAPLQAASRVRDRN